MFLVCCLERAHDPKNSCTMDFLIFHVKHVVYIEIMYKLWSHLHMDDGRSRKEMVLELFGMHKVTLLLIIMVSTEDSGSCDGTWMCASCIMPPFLFKNGFMLYCLYHFFPSNGWTAYLDGLLSFIYSLITTNLKSVIDEFLCWLPYFLLPVIGSSLSKNPSSGQVVARVNVLASDGWEKLFSTIWSKSLFTMYCILEKLGVSIFLDISFSSSSISLFERLQKNFEGKLVGADRAKDLAVLKVDSSLQQVFMSLVCLQRPWFILPLHLFLLFKLWNNRN